MACYADCALRRATRGTRHCPKCLCPMQVTFVRSHFTEIVSGEENLGLPELPKDVIQSLLSSEELETQSEDDILEVVLSTSLNHC